MAIEQLSPFPDAIQAYGIAVPVVLGTVAAFILPSDKKAVRENEAKFGVDLGINGPAVEHMAAAAIVATGDNQPVTDQYFDGRKRLTNSRFMILGFAGLLSVAALQPTVTEKVPVPVSSVTTLLDGTFSSTLTNDISKTQGGYTSRFESAVHGLVASDYNGNIAVVQAGSGNNGYTQVSLGPDNKHQIASNVHQLPYSEQGADCLIEDIPSSVTQGVTTELLIISDGSTIESGGSAADCADVPSLSSVASTLKRKNIDVKVIVPGTNNNNIDGYSYKGSEPVQTPVLDGVNEFEAAFGTNSVTTVTTQKAMNAAVQKYENDAKSKKKPTESQVADLFWYLPIGLAGLIGWGRDRRRIRKSLVTNLSN